MVRVLTVAVLALAGFSASAEDKKPEAPTGTWVHSAGGFDLTFTFTKDTVMLTVMNGDNGAELTSKYTVDKDGVVKMKITKVVEKGSFPEKPPVGLETSFKWKAEGKTAKLSEFKGEGVEEAKELLEGEYTAKK